MASDRGGLSRKMAAIVHADITGSTALVQLDEALAHERINDAFKRISQVIEHYGGTVHEIRGDALVAEFPRASDAVCAALTFQDSNIQVLSELDDEIKPKIRIGVSLGEVIFADGQVTGAGVVLAQRVEQLAEPGGLCITAAIHEALPQHMPFDQYDLGEQEVKGFEETVRVYRVGLKTGEAIPLPEKIKQPKASNVLGLSAVVAAIVLVIAGGVAFWFQPWQPEEEPASVDRMAFPLPDKPSIAVLPFDNLSGRSDQEYVSDGLTENIITTLSLVPDVFVIARNSTFAYKGQPVQIQKVAEELGVRYVLEGSYQREGDEIRIHAQLIDALDGRHLWAKRFDRNFSGIFALQDDITHKIVSSLSLKLTEEQELQLSKRYTHNVDAYDHFLRGLSLIVRYTKADNDQARDLYQRALDLDPRFARAVSGLAMTHVFDFRRNWSADPRGSLVKALALSQEAVELDEALPQAHWVVAQAAAFNREYDRATESVERSLSLDRNYADAYALLAFIDLSSGSAKYAIPNIQKAIRLNPQPQSTYMSVLGRAQFYLGAFDEARATLELAIELNPTNLVSQVFLAATLGQLGRREDAEWQAIQVLTLDPTFAISSWPDVSMLSSDSYRASLTEGLRRAGLLE